MTFRRPAAPVPAPASAVRLAALAAAAAFAVAACTSSGSGVPTIPPSPSPTMSPSPSPSPSATPTPSPTPTPSSLVAGCPVSQPDPLPAGEVRTVTFETEKGAIVIKVEGSFAPIAAGNFVALAECGWYTNTVFHRLVPDFVIQGGDGEFGRQPSVNTEMIGRGGPGYRIADEPVVAIYARGTVAMARTQEPNSQGSQFFIVTDDGAREALESYNTYAIFGTVASGMDVVDEIAAMPNSGPETGNMALDPVVITAVTVTNP